MKLVVNLGPILARERRGAVVAERQRALPGELQVDRVDQNHARRRCEGARGQEAVDLVVGLTAHPGIDIHPCRLEGALTKSS